MIQELYAIVAVCSILPALMNSTKQNCNSKINSKENKGIMTLLLHASNVYHKKCFSKILEIVGTFQQDCIVINYKVQKINYFVIFY